ncbi:DUF3833 domain-containing protein [Rhodobacterales bacterium]|nr:DUF3833 domain-containing protein [Rhodobacterales bacterium]
MTAFHKIILSFLAAFILTLPAGAAELRLEDFFKGRTSATGSFGTITGYSRQFDVSLHGRWDGRTLVLREDFRYDDGEKDTKTWRFRKTGWNTYIGTREDVLGEAKVILAGDEAYFNYLVDLDEGEGRNIVRFYDKLTLSADGQTIVNTARVFKGPLPVAWVRVDFKR